MCLAGLHPGHSGGHSAIVSSINQKRLPVPRIFSSASGRRSSLWQAPYPSWFDRFAAVSSGVEYGNSPEQFRRRTGETHGTVWNVALNLTFFEAGHG